MQIGKQKYCSLLRLAGCISYHEDPRLIWEFFENFFKE